MTQKTLFDFIPIDPCHHLFLSKVNGGLYCHYKKTRQTPYCIYNPGNAIQAYSCPMARSRIYPLKGF